MNLFGLSITRTKSNTIGTLSNVDNRGTGWFRVLESFAGAWQSNVTVELANVLTYAAVYACVTLIASDIGKLRICLKQKDSNDIWTDTDNSAFSPVLRKPNRYQTRIKFLENWITSKLINGNAYILKERNHRGSPNAGNVKALYVLDPCRVRPLVASDGSVYYAVNRDPLVGVLEDKIGEWAIPASEIIHDVMVPLYHPLVGISPITACGVAAVQGLRIQEQGAVFFGNGSRPSGVLTAPLSISLETATRLKESWDTNFAGSNAGKVAVLGDGLSYQAMSMTATDSQLIEQLKWTAENVCTSFHVPPYMVGVGAMPAYNNIEALNQQYYAQALQNPIESIELLLDEGLELPPNLGVELDLDGLLRMDTATLAEVATKAIQSGNMAPNESRKRFYGLGPVAGGASPYLQQQNFSLAALAKRDAQDDPFTRATAKVDASAVGVADAPASGATDAPPQAAPPQAKDIPADIVKSALSDMVRQRMESHAA